MAVMEQHNLAINDYKSDEYNHNGLIKKFFSLISTPGISSPAKRIWLLMISDALRRRKQDRLRDNVLAPELIKRNFGSTYRPDKVLKAAKELQSTVVRDVRALGSNKEIAQFQLCGVVRAITSLSGDKEVLTGYTYNWPSEIVDILNDESDAELLIDFRCVASLGANALELWLRCSPYVSEGITPFFSVRDFCESILSIDDGNRDQHRALYRNSDSEDWNPRSDDLEIDWTCFYHRLRKYISGINKSPHRVFSIQLETNGSKGIAVTQIRFHIRREKMVLLEASPVDSESKTRVSDEEALQILLKEYYRDYSLASVERRPLPAYSDAILLTLLQYMGVRASVAEQEMEQHFAEINIDQVAKTRQMIDTITAVFNQSLDDKIRTSVAGAVIHALRNPRPKQIEQEVTAFKKRFAVHAGAIEFQLQKGRNTSQKLTYRQALIKLRTLKRRRVQVILEIMAAKGQQQEFNRDFLCKLAAGFFGGRYKRFATPAKVINDPDLEVESLGRGARALYEHQVTLAGEELGLLGKVSTDDMLALDPSIRPIIEDLNLKGIYELDDIISELSKRTN